MAAKRVSTAARDGKPTERKRLRLVKILVQPVVVLDDGLNLSEQTFDVITVPAEEWPEFPKRLEGELKGLEAKANE